MTSNFVRYFIFRQNINIRHAVLVSLNLFWNGLFHDLHNEHTDQIKIQLLCKLKNKLLIVESKT